MSNAGVLMIGRDVPGATEQVESALALGRRTGDQYFEAIAIGSLVHLHLFAGRWEEAERLAAELIASQSEWVVEAHAYLASLKAWRGEPAGHHIAPLAELLDSDDLQTKFIARSAALKVAGAEQRFDEVLEEGPAVVRESLETLGPSSETIRHLWPDTVDAALAAGRLDLAGELVDLLRVEPRGRVAPYLRAELHRATGRLAAARGEHEAVEGELLAAVQALRELGYPYLLARAEIDLAEWLASRGRPAEAAPLLDEAVAELVPLRAAPALARAEQLRAGIAPAVA